ncbi:peptidase S8/S53 domain-containing protein [Pelagophyceae sp. CCMP2097]|nr:peptidase S8/S53 domain-containing protein [Pelagophyceae sp. CCMP2097]
MRLPLLAALLAGARADKVDLSGLADGWAEVSNRVLFKLQADEGVAAYHDSAKAVGWTLGCTSTSRLFRHAGKHEADQAAAGLNLWYAASCETSTVAVAAMLKFAANWTAALDTIDYMEPDRVQSLYNTANDPLLQDQPHYDAMNLFEAWDLTTGSSDVIVQVLDTGLNLNHEDFQNNIWLNPGEICDNGLDDDGNGFIDDCHGYNHADDTGLILEGNGWHGSHVAGTIAADTDNGKGVAGVAGGTVDKPGVKLMISVGFGKTATGGFAEALIYGANNGARISSNSWGYTQPGSLPQSAKAAIDYYNLKNGIVVFAAGNEASDLQYNPGAYQGVVGVAAVDNDGKAAAFTNYGSHIDLAAPGVDVLSTKLNGYGKASGTSMACPHVAGVFALGWSVKPDASKEMLLNCAYSTARNVDSVNIEKYQGSLGAGFMDAHAFLRCLLPTPSPSLQAPNSPEPSAKPTSIAPTFNCVCDQKLSITLKTDDYPLETAWSLTAESECAEDVMGVGYPLPATDYAQEVNVCKGVEYTFKITDTYGDGLCCEYGAGGYRLSLEGVEVAAGGVFRLSEETTFLVQTPTPFPTPNPTPAPLPTPQPTPEPTPPMPTLNPTPEPTPAPTPQPTPEPTQQPTLQPTPPMLTPMPTPEPTPPMPTMQPSLAPTPTSGPTTPPTPPPTPSTPSPTMSHALRGSSAPTAEAPTWAYRALVQAKLESLQSQLDQVMALLSSQTPNAAPLCTKYATSRLADCPECDAVVGVVDSTAPVEGEVHQLSCSPEQKSCYTKFAAAPLITAVDAAYAVSFWARAGEGAVGTFTAMKCDVEKTQTHYLLLTEDWTFYDLTIRVASAQARSCDLKFEGGDSDDVFLSGVQFYPAADGPPCA